MRVYAWHNSRHAGLIPASRRVDLVDLGQSPADAARRMADDLDDVLPGERIVMIPGNLRVLIDLSDPRRTHSPIGANVHRLAAWAADMLWALRQRVETIDAVWLDIEGWSSVWDLKGEAHYDYLRAVSGSDARDDATYIDVMDRDRQAMVNAVSRCFVEPIKALWPDARVSNYGDINPSFGIYYHSGWPATKVTTTAISSPSLYLTSAGKRYEGRAAPARWNRFIDTLNWARSCIATGPLIPWIAPPGYDGTGYDADPRLWIEQQKHLIAMGVEEVLYWNSPAPYRTPEQIARDDSYAAWVWWYWSKRIKPTTEPLGEIPMDAIEVRTGSVVTRLEDVQ